MSWDFLKKKTGRILRKCRSMELYRKILNVPSNYNFILTIVFDNIWLFNVYMSVYCAAILMHRWRSIWKDIK